MFLGEFFWENFFERIFLGGFCLGGILSEEFFVYIVKVSYSVDSIKRTVHLTFHGIFFSIKNTVFLKN